MLFRTFTPPLIKDTFLYTQAWLSQQTRSFLTIKQSNFDNIAKIETGIAKGKAKSIQYAIDQLVKKGIVKI